MDKTRVLLLTGFFHMLSEQQDIAEKVILTTVETHSLSFTREEISEFRGLFYPHPEWLPAELELYRILGL